MLATTLEADPYLGRVLTGRIYAGHGRRPTRRSSRCRATARSSRPFRITKILAFRGIERIPADEAEAGDIVALAGMTTTTVADTICAIEVETPLQAQPIDPPTLAMTFSINDSPLAGTEGDKVTSRVIGARLMREAESNVAIHISTTDSTDSFEVAGRGELQLGVLIETDAPRGLRARRSRGRAC